jgi:reactive chlorine resistance protein C
MWSNSLKVGKQLQNAGAIVLRYSLVLFFVGFGLFKFTPQEAAGVQPMIANSPALFWIYRLFDVRHGSDFIGVIEITFGVLMAIRPLSAKLSALGSLGTAFALCTTLSFLFTTPGLEAGDQGFLMKDLTLLGAALWTAGEALVASSTKATPMLATA